MGGWILERVCGKECLFWVDIFSELFEIRTNLV